MNARFTTNTLMPVGLVAAIVAGGFYAGISFHQIGVNAEDNEGQADDIEELQGNVTRGLILQENQHSIAAQQGETQRLILENLQALTARDAQQQFLIEFFLQQLRDREALPPGTD